MAWFDLNRFFWSASYGFCLSSFLIWSQSERDLGGDCSTLSVGLLVVFPVACEVCWPQPSVWYPAAEGGVCLLVQAYQPTFLLISLSMTFQNSWINSSYALSKRFLHLLQWLNVSEHQKTKLESFMQSQHMLFSCRLRCTIALYLLLQCLHFSRSYDCYGSRYPKC